MFKSLSRLFPVTFIAISISGCSGCDPESSNAGSPKTRQTDHSNDSSGGFNSRSGEGNNKKGGSGPNYRNNKIPDPREKINAQEGLCDAVYKRNAANIAYFLKRNRGSINDSCFGYTGTDKLGQFTPTPIMMAIENMDVFELLVTLSNVSGDDTISYRYDGNTYLQFAVLLGSQKALEVLARRSAPFLDRANSRGYTALFMAIEHARALEFVEILLQNGADPSHRVSINGKNTYPVDFAIALKKLDVAILIKKYGGKTVDVEPLAGEFIQRCLNEFLDKADDLKKEHNGLKASIEKEICSYPRFEEVLNGTGNLIDAGCLFGARLKGEFQAFSTKLHRQLRRNAAQFATDHCRHQPNADIATCHATQVRFNACLDIAKKGKDF